MSKKEVSIETIHQKKESREISKKILDFGVTDAQKIDIMLNLAMTLEDNKSMKDIIKFLKKYTNSINKDENSNTIESRPNKILIN